MQILYRSHKIEKICTVASEAVKLYGLDMARKIHQRIDELSAAESVSEMVQYGIGRCHLLKGNRKGEYALDLVHPYRLVFKIVNDSIDIVCIREIVDYH